MSSTLFAFVEDQIRTQYALYLAERCAHQGSGSGRKLNLVRLKLRQLPAALAECTFLAKLSLDGNLLSSESILVLGSLKFLRYLTLNDNKLCRFPEELCRLKFVEFLNVGGNPIDGLPEAIGKLKNLISLWCNDMLLEQLPEALGSLRKLRTFGARNNRLRSLPDSFGTGTKRLRWLTLAGNRIANLPETFAQLTNLTHLNLAGNCLREIPGAISQLHRLKYCSLMDNAIGHVDATLLQELSHVGKLELLGNLIDAKILQNFQPSGMNYHFDLTQENVSVDWEHSLPNSAINSPDASDSEDTDVELVELNFLELARYCCTG